MTIRAFGERPRHISRRGLLIGGGAGVGLLLAWTVWPRTYAPNLVASPGEVVLNGYVKVANTGQVTVAVPEMETGQGAYTLFAQIVADELGADWRTVGVEPAPINPLYGNQASVSAWPGLTPTTPFSPPPPQLTDEAFAPSTFEAQARDAGAAARALLCMAAAKRWGADWMACETENGFVVLGNDRLRFADLAEDAADFEIPDTLPLRTGRENRLLGQSVPRIDAPAKVDGSANFAADVRLPGMVYAAVRAGPLGDTRFKSMDEARTTQSRDVLRVIKKDRWVAVVAKTWWAAQTALDAARPRFETQGPFPEEAEVAKALRSALQSDGTEMARIGDVDAMFENAKLLRADYSAGFRPHASLETLAATAVPRDGKLEVWIQTQAPGLARSAIAKACDLSEDDVIVHPMLLGGSFGRNHDHDAAVQAAQIAIELDKPVQLVWSRSEDMMQDRFGPPAMAQMFARLGPAGQIEAWRTRIAAPATLAETKARIAYDLSALDAQKDNAGARDPSAVSGALPPYALPNVSIVHHPADIGVPTGKLRGGADVYTTFFREAFIDELSKQSGVEGFSFRMAMLGGNPRLATCLSKVTVLGKWEGGAEGTQQGLACHSMQGSHIAVLAEAYVSDGNIVVPRLYAVADVGRILHPDIALQQIQGGLLFGLAMALGNAVGVERGLPTPRTLGGLRLPRISDVPNIQIEIIPSREPSGGLGEIGTAAVAPAIANALWAGSGRRYRSLPLLPGNT